MPHVSDKRVVVLAAALALGACQQLSSMTGAGTIAGRETGVAGPSAGAVATTQRTDPDMSQVIAALSALGAQPVEALSVERPPNHSPHPGPPPPPRATHRPAPIPPPLYGPARGRPPLSLSGG